MITQQQINYYNSLRPEEQHVLKIAAMRAHLFSVSDINPVIKLKYKMLSGEVLTILERGVQHGLLRSIPGGRNYFSIELSFMIYIFPMLKDLTSEWKQINIDGYYNSDPLREFRNMLYYLLYDQQTFVKLQEQNLKFGFNLHVFTYFADIFDNEAYENVIPLLHGEVLGIILSQKLDQAFLNLGSLTELHQTYEKIKLRLSSEQIQYLPNLDQHVYMQSGNFAKLIEDELKAKQSNPNSQAIEVMTKGNVEAALILLEKGLKIQRSHLKGSQLPTLPHTAFYYLTALFCISSEIATPVFRKILNALDKKAYTRFDNILKAAVLYGLNEKQRLPASMKLLSENVRSEAIYIDNLMSTLMYYLIAKEPDVAAFKHISSTIKRAAESGFLVLAYEAAYALRQWNTDAENEKLYNELAVRLNYQPVLSRISRQEEWEKSLNLLLGMGLGKPAKATATDDGVKARVIYYVNPQSNYIQPVLQSRLIKGGWSKGRNIAMKTFYQGTVEGMTEQDSRIAKTIRRVNTWSGDEYDFTYKSIKELIGHPYVFLNGTVDVPVELVAAQPVIQVTKSSKGYSLKTDIKDASESFFIEKETNTRYRIYDLTPQQRQIINIIQQQQIMVPEQGKEKLVQLLGGFGAHMTVHSDLLATQSERTNVKEVEADNRIRVQLLPLGDGLKAELYAKPFGSHPPYCKPGKGGKVLIANEHGEQLQVKRNLKQETEYANALMNDIQSLESLDVTDELISFDEPLDSLELLDILTAHQDKCVVEWPEGERFKIKGTVSFSNLNLRLKSKSNWFELQGELKVDENTVLTIQQLLELTDKGHDRFIELGQGEFLALSEQLKKQLQELRSFSTVGKDGMHINKFASMALGDFFEDVENLKVDKAWKEFRSRVEKVQQADIPVPANLQAELRPYQEEGFRWLSRLAEWEGGACLADDMGLGKTVQTLSILLHRAQSGPALVVCPVSVLPNWVSETAKFAPTLNVKTLSNGNREEILKSLEPGDLLVTSYGLLQSEEKALAKITFATVVLDEAHTIKNFATKTSKAAMQLQANFRVALTGTPLQNHLGEIWNLFNFINPGLLGTMQHFTDIFIKPDNEHARKHLKKLITPFILRRTKSAVLDELPPKTEIIKKVQLSDEEMAYYEALRRQAIFNLENDDSPQGAKHLKTLAEITRLRQACCNPALVDPAINISSTKLSTFLEIVGELTENKHRALVFSQFVTHLAIVRKALDKQGIKYQYLDGSTPMAEREKSVKAFQGGEGELFLISLKAGGLGLNLTAADYVIHLDPWWNPAIEDQASDRAHRFGQSRPVTIYRLVAENTIEEKIIQLHNTKRDLADSLLEGSDQSAKLSVTELMSLIKERD